MSESTWSSKDLMVGYNRRVAGLDVRVANGRQLPGTIDPEHWPRVSEDILENDRNGLGLIDAPLSAMLDATPPNDGVIVAFDIPAGLWDEVSAMFGLQPFDDSRVLSSAHWQRIGFDITDIRTQSSAIHSFDWKKRELARFSLNAVRASVRGDW